MLNCTKNLIRIGILLIAIGQGGLLSKTILFKDGRRIRGEIVDQDKFHIQLKTLDGSIRSISKDEILKIQYKDHLTKEELDSIQREKEDLDRKRLEMAEIYSRGITPLPQELKESEEVKVYIENNPYKKTTAFGAFFRSLVIPGWGQFYQGRQSIGTIYGGLVLGGIAGYYRQDQVYQAAKDDYNRMRNPFSESVILDHYLRNGSPTSNMVASSGQENLNNNTEFLLQREMFPLAQQRNSVDGHFRRRENIGVGLALVWIWNAFDAYLFHPIQYNKEPILGLQENLDSNIWILSIDTVSLPSILDSKPNVEHRFQFTVFY